MGARKRFINRQYHVFFILSKDGERCSSRTTTVLSYSADMFAFGCCIYGIFSGRHLIHNVRAYQELCSGSFPEMVPEIVDKFVQRRLDQLFCDESDDLGAIVSTCLKGQALLRQSAGSARADLARKVEQLGARWVVDNMVMVHGILWPGTSRNQGRSQSCHGMERFPEHVFFLGNFCPWGWKLIQKADLTSML